MSRGERAVFLQLYNKELAEQDRERKRVQRRR